MTNKICPECGKEQENIFKFCTNCGALLCDAEDLENSIIENNVNEVICNDCGLKQEKIGKFCKNCGALLPNKNTVQTINLNSTDDMKVCPDCGEEQEKIAKFCKNCGFEFSENDNDTVFKCKYCGAVLTNEEFCPDCGKATGVKICPNCRETSRNKDFCPTCGHRLNENIKKCHKCGSVINSKANICSKCGASTSYKNPTSALVLSFIFPGLGQFYNNQNRKAITIIIGNFISFLFVLFIIGIVLSFLIWIYAMYDANTTAKALNRGEVLNDSIF